MLVQHKKRQSFSIDSLAVSSRVTDDDGPHRRDTDSPYLNYIQSSHTNNVDYNLNFKPTTSNHAYDVTQFCDPTTVVNKKGVYHQRQLNDNGPTLLLHSTSTPKVTSNKRKRSCSTSRRSPSSDESCEENMTIDSSATTDDLSDGKLSPVSAGSISTTSEADTESLGEEFEGSRRKKARTAFTGEQLRELEGRYKGQKYLTASDRTQLARTLRLRDQQVKTWFQNRRMKEKRQQRDEEHSSGFHLPTGGVDIAQLAALGICAPPNTQLLGSSQPLNFNFNAAISPSARDHQHPGLVANRNVTESTNQFSPSFRQDRTSPVHQNDTSAGSMFTALDMRAVNEFHTRFPTTSVNSGTRAGLHAPVPVMPKYGLTSVLSHSPSNLSLYPH